MYIQFNEYWYKRGCIGNPNYTYKIEENMDKPSLKKPGRGTWEITEITYYFKGEKAIVEVTDESRSMVSRVKMDDENRINRELNKRKLLDAEVSYDLLPEQADIDNPIERLESREYLDNAINQLPDKQQRVIRQRFFEDMSTTEIAENEGVAMSAISHREKRALDNLKKILMDVN